jgi:hypothetical protein
MSVSVEVGDQVQVRTNGGSPAARKYAGKEGYATLVYGGFDKTTLIIDVRLFGNNFDTVLKGEDLLTAKEGEEPVIVGLLSGLESQSKLSQLLEKVFGVSPSEQSIIE